MKIIFYRTLLFFLLFPLFLSGENNDTTLLAINDLLNNELVRQLIETGEVTRFHEDNFSLEIIPNTNLSSRIIQVVSAGKLNLGTEALYLNSNLDIREFNKSPENLLLHYYNVLNAVNTLEGLEYYSASRKKMRLLFEESWRIENQENPAIKLDDLFFSQIPAQNSFLVHQKDKTFGKSESRMEYSYDSPIIYTSLTNISPLYYTIVKVIDPEEMQIHMMIIPTDHGLLFYGIMGADTISLSVFRNKARNSFYNRIKALYNWFSEEAGLK